MHLTKQDYTFLSDYLENTPDIQGKTVFDIIKTVSFDVREKLIRNPFELYSDLDLDIELESEYSLRKLSVASIVLLEWDWEYEKILKSKSKEEKLEMYYLELNRSINTNFRLRRYVKENNDAFWDKNIIDLYNELSLIIFGTDSLDEINKNFSKVERKNYRVFIVKFLNTLEILKKKKSVIKDWRDLIVELNKLKDFQIDESEDVEYEFLPYGLVVYLKDSTFDSYLWSWNTRGLEINWNILWLMNKETDKFKDFWGSILFIKWDKNNKDTFDHEHTHLIYDKFFRNILDFEHEQLIWLYWYEDFFLWKEKNNDIKFSDFLNKTLNTLYNISIELAKDEANAYFKEGISVYLLSNLWFDSFSQVLDDIIIDLKEYEKVNETKYLEYRKQIIDLKDRYIKELWFYSYIINFFKDNENNSIELSNRDNLWLLFQMFISKWNKKLIQTLGYQFKSFKENFEKTNDYNLETISNFINYEWDFDSMLETWPNLDNLISAINFWTFHYQDEYFYYIIELLKKTSNETLEENLLIYIEEYFKIYWHQKDKIIRFQEELYSLPDKYWDYKYYYIDLVDKLLVEDILL